MYAAVYDYTRVLAELLKDKAILLRTNSVDQQKKAGKKQQCSCPV
jgi:hypothetical protein